MHYSQNSRYIILGLIFMIFIIPALFYLKTPAPTGLVVQQEDKEQYARTLNHVVLDFFGTAGIVLPQGTCVDVVKGLYNEVAFKPLDTTQGFGTKGTERTATINFVVDRTITYGTVDLVKGKTLIGKEGVDSMLSMYTERTTHVPKKDRITFFSLDLYGNSAGVFVVTSGRLSTPTIDCGFTSSQGIAHCSCQSHSGKGWWSD